MSQPTNASSRPALSEVMLPRADNGEGLSSISLSMNLIKNNQNLDKSNTVQKSPPPTADTPVAQITTAIIQPNDRTTAATSAVDVFCATDEPIVIPALPKNVFGEHWNDLHSSQYESCILRYSLVRDQYFKALIDAEALNKHRDITERMRAILVDWLVEIHLRLPLMHDTLFITISLLDRYLSKDLHMHRSQLQLAGLACLSLACKLEEVSAPELKELVFLSENSYTVQELVKAEVGILKVVDFNGFPVSPLIYIEYVAKVCNWTERMKFLSFYFLELTLLAFPMSRHSAAARAAASAYLTNRVFSLATPWPLELQRLFYNGVSTPLVEQKNAQGEVVSIQCVDISDLVEQVLTLKLNESKDNLQLNVYEEYESFSNNPLIQTQHPVYSPGQPMVALTTLAEIKSIAKEIISVVSMAETDKDLKVVKQKYTTHFLSVANLVRSEPTSTDNHNASSTTSNIPTNNTNKSHSNSSNPNQHQSRATPAANSQNVHSADVIKPTDHRNATNSTHYKHINESENNSNPVIVTAPLPPQCSPLHQHITSTSQSQSHHNNDNSNTQNISPTYGVLPPKRRPLESEGHDDDFDDHPQVKRPSLEQE